MLVELAVEKFFVDGHHFCGNCTCCVHITNSDHLLRYAKDDNSELHVMTSLFCVWVGVGRN